MYVYCNVYSNECMCVYLSMEDSFWSDDLLKDVFPDVRVDGRERVIQEVDVCLLVDCSRQTHPLLLTSTQVDPLTCVWGGEGVCVGGWA